MAETEHPPAQFLIEVHPIGDFDRAEVRIGCSDPAPPFAYWLCMVEYLMHVTAQKSNAGYEGALEAFCRGAMTWRHREEVDHSEIGS